MKNKRHLILFAVILVLAGYSAWVFSASITPYVTIKDAMASKQNVQVKGLLDKSIAPPRQEGEVFTFYLDDEHGDKMLVHYQGIKPEQFDEAHHIVAIGKFTGEVFRSHQLLLKCPSKYERERAS